jgi:ParB family chromosome partitioning protein
MATMATTKRRSLGRGLGALLGQPEPDGASEVVAKLHSDEELQKLPVDLLQRGKYQPRIDMRPETLQELADSIKAQGVVQPIVVRPLDGPEGEGHARYEIIAGERRWRAAQLAGLHEIPAVVRRVPDEAAIAMALIENIQREDLNPLEEARALLALETKRQQAEVGALVAKKNLSVRETEALVKRLTAQPQAAAEESAPRVDPNIRKLESELSEKLGAKVAVQHTASGKGKLVISYHTLDELDGILDHIR